MIELIVLALVTVVGLVFILNARTNFSREDERSRKKEHIPTADEEAPTQTGRHKAKSMLAKSKKSSQKRNRVTTDSSTQQDGTLPDPFAEKNKSK